VEYPILNIQNLQVRGSVTKQKGNEKFGLLTRVIVISILLIAMFIALKKNSY